MAKVTLVFAVLLIALGLGFYLGTGSKAPTALIPTWFGVALGLFGILANSPEASRRKLFMHINVTIGLLGFLGRGDIDQNGGSKNNKHGKYRSVDRVPARHGGHRHRENSFPQKILRHRACGVVTIPMRPGSEDLQPFQKNADRLTAIGNQRRG